MKYLTETEFADPKRPAARKVFLTASLTLLLLATTACTGINERLSRIGQPPAMSGLQTPQNLPGASAKIQLPMPPKQEINTASNSLWQPGRQTFFKDQRAHKTGDILTVMINIADDVLMQNRTQRDRVSNEEVDLNNLLGFEDTLGKILPNAYTPSTAIDVDRNSTSLGNGQVLRQEDINMKLAAMIVDVLPNGNFIIRGQQEVRVNSELREVTLDGVIRPEDIMNNNSISYDKIAEARISYGGRGQIMDVQQPRYGQQVYEAIFPF